MYICRSMRHIYLVIFSALISSFAIAQDKPYGSDFSQGNVYFLKKDYSLALKSFSAEYKTDTVSANLNYKIGLCYLHITGSKNLASHYLEKAVKDINVGYDPASNIQKFAPRQAFYYLGMAYHEAMKFGEAINSFKTYRQYITLTAKDSLAELDHRIEECTNARMFIMVPNNARIINLGDSVNSGYSDYNAVVPADESSIIFTSSRPTSNNAQPGPNGEYHSYIYISSRKSDTTWTTAKMFDKALNGMMDNMSAYIAPDGQQMLVYGTNDNGSNIMVSFPGEDGHWEMPKDPGGDINTPAEGTNSCLSSDGNTLYFVSERPDGYGGKDIWRCVKLPNGKWSLAVNLGNVINTPYNEESPYMHVDGRTFFFSSEGHNSIGGYDIFFTQLLENGKWVEPFNLGYPINTPDNEVHFSLSADGKRGYLNSDRPGGKGNQDIYMVYMPQSGEKPLTVIKGQISIENGSSLPDDIHIVATDNVTGLNVGDFKPVKATGSYTIIVPPGKSYTLSYQNDDKEFYSEVIQVPADAGYKEIHKELTLSSVTWKVTAIKDDK
jgi:hypothetical protein